MKLHSLIPTAGILLGMLASACGATQDGSNEETAASSAGLSGMVQPATLSAQTFQPLSLNDVVVLGWDGKLWYEHAPFGSLPPQRMQIDGNVQTFQVAGSVANAVYVLGKDGNLWRETPNGQVPPPRMLVDSNVSSFQWASDGTGVFVLSNGNLFLEWPNGNVPPLRTLVDQYVKSFQIVDGNHVVVLDNNGKLWMVVPPYGIPAYEGIPPKRTPIDAGVVAFQPLSASAIAVLGYDGNLWMEIPDGNVPPTRRQVDGNVAAFQVLDGANVLVLGKDGILWLELPNGTVPPPRALVDANVMAFSALDALDVTVLSKDGNLWFEHGPFNKFPPRRELIDKNVRIPQGLPGGECMRDGVSTWGRICFPGPTTCANDICQHCGRPGEYCCDGAGSAEGTGSACEAGLLCQSNPTAGHFTCQATIPGKVNAPCKAGSVCDDGLACVPENNTCYYCGGHMGRPCPTGKPCRDIVHTTDQPTHEPGGVIACDVCGQGGEGCCVSGNACQNGLVCQDNRCVQAPPPPPPPKEDGCGLRQDLPRSLCCMRKQACDADWVCKPSTDGKGHCYPPTAPSTGAACGGKAPVTVSICVEDEWGTQPYVGLWCSEEDAKNAYEKNCEELKTEHGYSKCDVGEPNGDCPG